MRPRRVLETALYCDDVPTAARFYTALGLTPIFESERLIAMDGGEGTIVLLFRRGHTANGLATPGGFVPGHDGSGPAHMTFAIDTADLAAWESRLTLLGVA